MVLLICNIRYAGAVQAALATLKQRQASEDKLSQTVLDRAVQFSIVSVLSFWSSSPAILGAWLLMCLYPYLCLAYVCLTITYDLGMSSYTSTHAFTTSRKMQNVTSALTTFRWSCLTHRYYCTPTGSVR